MWECARVRAGHCAPLSSHWLAPLLALPAGVLRRHFPVELKSHRSHDVVLLCVACHQTAQAVRGPFLCLRGLQALLLCGDELNNAPPRSLLPAPVQASEVCKRQVLRDYGVPLHAPRVLASAAAGAAGGGNPCDHRDSSSCGSGDDADQVEEQRDHDCGGEGQCRRDVSAPSSSSGPSAASAVPAQDPLQAQRAAVALGKAAARLPPARRLELEHTIKRALGRHPAGEPEGERDLSVAGALSLATGASAHSACTFPPTPLLRRPARGGSGGGPAAGAQRAAAAQAAGLPAPAPGPAGAAGAPG